MPNSEVVAIDAIYGVKCDIYAPCALGATVNDKTVEQFKCKIVAGAANNQLAEQRHGDILRSRGILYAPDYLINAGGLMNVSIEFEGWSDSKARRMVETIYDTTLEIFRIADRNNTTTYKAADMWAESRIESIRRIGARFMGISQHRFPGRKRRHSNG